MNEGVLRSQRLSRKENTSVFTCTSVDVLATTFGTTTNYHETSAMCYNKRSFSELLWLDGHGGFLFDTLLVASNFENAVIRSSSFQASLQGLACSS
ncbi:hypothetical protein DFH28DRAFT_1083458 [Melampsora americana]|nr:hypothetical protein DFH28DRAFT_1083458 [Melampsora americana]